MTKTYIRISVHSLRESELHPHIPCALYTILSHSRHPFLSPPNPEFLCWLLSLEGGGRYLYDLQMKPNEGECIQSNTAQRKFTSEEKTKRL